MRKKILLSLGAVLVVVTGVAAMSAFEAHIINVTAHIENALSVSPEEIAFGTVFPQERLYKDLTISLSGSFMEEDRVDDVEYKIVQKPKVKVMTTLITDVLAGDDIIDVETIVGMEAGDFILISPDLPNFEFRRIKSIMDSPILLDSPLSNNHSAGETVMTIYEYLCTYLSKLPDGVPLPGNDTGIGSPHHPPQCMDGVDNDLDGKIDYSVDPECASFWDNDEAIAGDQPMVTGRLAKSERDIQDNWTIDLVVPCFQGMCAQDYTWEEYGPPIPPELEGETFGCDLWVEVTGISETPHGSECEPGLVYPCNTGLPGICAEGTKTCDPSGYWGECVGPGPSAEICNDGIDNDCDSYVDCDDSDCSSDPACASGPTPECEPGNTLPCDTGLMGICVAGTQTCSPSGFWGACVQNEYSSTEVCDGLDNDCDGLIDEDAVCGPPNSWTYEQKFNTLNDGDLNGQDSWSGNTAYDVQTTQTYEGAKALELVGSAPSGIVRDITGITEGLMSIAMRVTQAPPAGNFSGIILREGGTGRMYVRFDNSGYIQIYDNVAAAYQNIQTYNVNQWYVIAIEFDDAAQPNKYRAKVHDGTSWGTWTSWYTVNGGSYVQISRIELLGQLASWQTTYWDTITPY